MRITKCENGLFKVTLKGLDVPFYVENQADAWDIVIRMGGTK